MNVRVWNNLNANYHSARWCRDVDLLITDTNATSNFYKEKSGFVPLPVGKFIDRGQIIAKKHKRQNSTFINPSWPKGAGFVAQIAIVLEKLRPDIQLEIVESRGDWNAVVSDVQHGFFHETPRALGGSGLRTSDFIKKTLTGARLPGLWVAQGSQTMIL